MDSYEEEEDGDDADGYNDNGYDGNAGDKEEEIKMFLLTSRK